MKTDWIGESWRDFVESQEEIEMDEDFDKKVFFSGALTALVRISDTGVPFNEIPKPLQDLFVSMQTELQAELLP
jgi:hypothetical protein